MSPRLTSPRSWSSVELITETEYRRPGYSTDSLLNRRRWIDGLRVLSSSTVLKTMWFFYVSSLRLPVPQLETPLKYSSLSATQSITEAMSTTEYVDSES